MRVLQSLPSSTRRLESPRHARCEGYNSLGTLSKAPIVRSTGGGRLSCSDRTVLPCRKHLLQYVGPRPPSISPCSNDLVAGYCLQLKVRSLCFNSLSNCSTDAPCSEYCSDVDNVPGCCLIGTVCNKPPSGKGERCLTATPGRPSGL